MSTVSAPRGTSDGKLIVAKFGGSSCGSAEAYGKLGDFFASQLDAGHRMVGVFSAMFGVTDRLLAALYAANEGDKKKVAECRESIWSLHCRTIDAMPELSEGLRAECKQWVDSRLETFFDSTIASVLEKRSFSAHDQDMVSHMGERLSICMMDALCRSRGMPSVLVESDAILITNDVSGNATPQLDLTQEKVRDVVSPLLEDGKLPIVSGFFGTSSETGKLTTIGRGGTDLTAAVLGHALDADEIQLHKVEYSKDADGWLDKWEPGWIGVVHDADPEYTIPVMSYRDAAQLAHFGKKVLHPATVHPAVEKQIPIVVKNNYDPTHPGTTICHTASSDVPVTSITSLTVDKYDERHSAVAANAEPQVDVIFPRDFAERDACRNLMPADTLDECMAGIHRIRCDGVRGTGIVFAEGMVENLENVANMLRERIENVKDESTDCDRSEMALIAIVGSSLERIPEIKDFVGRLLESENIPYTFPDRVNGSSDNVTVVVGSEHRKLVTKKLHESLVNKKIRRMDILGSHDFWSKQNRGASYEVPSNLKRSLSYLQAPPGFKPVYKPSESTEGKHDFAAF